MSGMKVVLVCGGRDFADYEYLCMVLDKLHAKIGTFMLRHGAARGADSLAERWAESRGLPFEPCPADWDTYGRAAGPIRNREMLKDGAVSLVVAFPGGRGTADMVKAARERGIKALEV